MDRTLFDLGDTAGDADHHAWLGEEAAVVHGTDEISQHLLGDFEVGYDTIAEGPDRDNIRRCTANHALCFGANGKDFLGYAVDRNDRRLIDDDAPALDHDESIRRSQVDRDVVREEPEDAGEGVEDAHEVRTCPRIGRT